ncbi:amphi-Trp domain-containing protein [Halomicroarcula salina]|uniref:Amphi-Trp domain-containing protein n=2 Tax=Haloarcula salina TaxID=1429914 RepID=A0AA41G1Z9_9EURY|nr:amphi-Trp domain-containing protein [Haloarcula salina]MBV0901923.1 amphi-Trp domain-containing protein [Haloarcula salina]
MTTLESERQMTRDEIAEYLHEFATQLDSDSTTSAPTLSGGSDEDDTRITFMVGNESQTIDPPESMAFEVEVESDSSLVGTGTETEVEFELSWTNEPSDEDERDEMEIR